MSRFRIYNKDCLSFSNNQYQQFSELADNSIDVVITSPPYNNGNCSYISVITDYKIKEVEKDISNEFTDNYPIDIYKERLEKLFAGVYRILKVDGIFVLDVNDKIICGQEGEFCLYDFSVKAGKAAGFNIFKRYPYEIAGENCLGHSASQHIILFTKSEKGEIKYSYLEDLCENEVLSNPFQCEYDFSKSVPREVCWPPELLLDFFKVLQLGDNKVVVDPYSGESALGLLVASQHGSGMSRFIGYEIIDKVAQRAVAFSKREFSFESVMFERNFYDAFRHDSNFQMRWQLSYIGAIVLDGKAVPFTCDKYYESPEDGFCNSLTKVTNTIQERKLPYLGSILGKVGNAEVGVCRVFIYRENKKVLVRYGGDSVVTKEEFERRFGLKNRDLLCFRLHCDILAKDGQFISFIPMVFRNNSFISILYYVVACGIQYKYNKMWAMSNEISRICQVASVPLQDRRIITLIEQFHEKSVRSAIGSIMSRNGSHNIGSHVLAALSHNVGTMPDDRVLYQYIQHRMDYIATAVGELPSWTYSTKFVGGVIREFLSQRHLLEYISKSEGLQAFKFQDPNHIGNNRFNQKNTIRLHVRRSDYGLPKGVNEVDFIEYSETNDDVQQRLQYDIDVALPGGVVGGHAFFTILENVIRNAAKHGWATKRDTERKDENLDIYVDFKRDEDCQNATVVVYDGISDVFSVLDEEKSNDVGERNGIRKLKDWIEANRETLCSSLDKKSLEQLKAYIEDKGENLPIPYGGLVNVLSESVDCGGDNNGKKKKVWEVIKGNLAGKTDSDKELGHRLWLPLHHSHQIKLATPFIDDAGSLRRENWGLAEMKISAGYLQMRTISEIGGLDSDVNGYDGFKKIITPVCVKHVSFSKDGKKETHHHLGYEFKIRCPRELLFVVQGEKPSGDAAKAAEQKLLRHGVHIRYIEDSGYDAVFALQNNPSRLEWDFRYVMLPAFPQVPNPKLPFRVLTGKRSCKWCVPHFQEYSTFRKRLESVLAGAEGAETWVHDLKKAVYKTWLAYWQSDRRKDIGKPVLSLVVDPGGGSGDGAGKRGGECLISDSDLWSVVLDNLFRTLVRQHLSLSFGHELEYRMKCYLVRIAVSDTREMLSDFDVSRPRYSLGRQIAAWFEKSNLENTPKDETLKSLAKDFMADGDAVPRQERDKILEKIVDGDYAAEIQQFHSSLKEWLRKCKNAKSSSEHDFEAPQVDVNGKSYNYPGFQKFMDSCLVAFEHSAVFLRKYEERIATLPESFQVKASGGDGTSFVNATAQIGIDAVTGGSIPESRKAIRYERHFDAGAFDRNTMAYAEPLSGTQTYLNMLGQLVGNNDCPIETVYSVSVSLMENALTRILIIDERTADFLKKHELSKQTYAHMGVWVLDDKTVEGCTPPQKSPDNKEWNPNVEQALLPASDIGVRIFTDMANCDDGDGEERRRWRKFDIVVIHQGLIDKWLSASAHDAKGVESLLERLKERVPYVVITTGRGTPSNTPATARILPFSVIEKTMFRQSPEKMILVDTVMNILPVGERKQ